MDAARVDIAVRRDHGLDRLINDLPRRSYRVAEKFADHVQTTSTASAPVLSGHMKQSIKTTTLGPGHYEVRVGAYYGVYVNFGTRHQQPQPFWSTSVASAKVQLALDMRKVFGKGTI